MTVTATVVTVTRKPGAIVSFTTSVRGSHLKPSQSCNDRHGKSGEHLQHPGGRHPETGSGLHKSFRPPASRPGCQKNAQVQKKDVCQRQTSFIMIIYCTLLSQTKSLNDGTVTVNVDAVQIIEQRTTLAYQLCQ